MLVEGSPLGVPSPPNLPAAAWILVSRDDRKPERDSETAASTDLETMDCSTATPAATVGPGGVTVAVVEVDPPGVELLVRMVGPEATVTAALEIGTVGGATPLVAISS